MEASATASKLPQLNQDTIIDGINSLLSMFKVIGQKPFPRNVMTANYDGYFLVNDIEHMYNVFEDAKFKDCRISAYPPVTENSILIPNILLLDIDYDDSLVLNNGREYGDKVNKTKVNKILKQLQTKFNITNFMVMHTGNGRQILIPFMFDSPFEEIAEFRKYLPYMLSRNKKNENNAVSEAFLPFAKKYLSNNQADPGNYPNFKSMFLRVPGTINAKSLISPFMNQSSKGLSLLISMVFSVMLWRTDL